MGRSDQAYKMRWKNVQVFGTFSRLVLVGPLCEAESRLVPGSQRDPAVHLHVSVGGSVKMCRFACW